MDLFRFPVVLFARFLAIVVMLIMLWGTQYKPAWAGDNLLDGFEDAPPASDDSILDGFEDTDRIKKNNVQDYPVEESIIGTRSMRLGGHIKAASSYSFAHDAPAAGDTDWRGFSRLKTEMLLELEVKPADDWVVFASGLAAYDFNYGIRGRDNYTEAVLDKYETDVKMRELYLQASPAKQLDIKIGRQIVVWGTSDYLRVVDVINPLDLKDPGITDIEELRLPVTLSKLDYYWGYFNLSGMLIHEIRFNETPPYGSDFYPYPEPPPPGEKPGNTLSNTQFALAFKGIFSGWDLGIYWADIYHSDTHTEASPGGDVSVLLQKHERVKMSGASSTLAAGNWIIKGEAVYWNGLKYTDVPHRSFSRFDLMIGFEYSGFNDTRITLEMLNQHIFDYKSELKKYSDSLDENQFQSVICAERDFMNEALTLTLLATAYGETWQGGSYQRISAEYEIAEALTVKGGVVFYHSGDLSMFNNIGGNDKLSLELKYSF